MVCHRMEYMKRNIDQATFTDLATYPDLLRIFVKKMKKQGTKQVRVLGCKHMSLCIIRGWLYTSGDTYCDVEGYFDMVEVCRGKTLRKSKQNVSKNQHTSYLLAFFKVFYCIMILSSWFLACVLMFYDLCPQDTRILSSWFLIAFVLMVYDTVLMVYYRVCSWLMSCVLMILGRYRTTEP